MERNNKMATGSKKDSGKERRRLKTASMFLNVKQADEGVKAALAQRKRFTERSSKS
ncbi:MAG: hypothetical protein VB061_10295 [Christensenella sp.]|nr:hypothetical protein [Christensenella sp.]